MAEDICPDGSSWTSPAGAICVRGTRIIAASVAAAHANITATAASRMESVLTLGDKIKENCENSLIVCVQAKMTSRTSDAHQKSE